LNTVSVFLSMQNVILVCEICGRGPAANGPWTLCPECYELYKTLFQFLRRHNVDPKDLKFLKEVLKSEAREIGLIA